ncbi:MAG TPA: hypothetical protein VFV92_11350, partial [Candidatus Bathyarchaeia archaeon]|nr:hypothetical protein [Candidatus Bathyarchaeia archaeon]
MRIKKMVSDKMIAANRENAKKSTGPREVAGKLAVRHGARYSSRNSLKHGFFARELVLSDAEKLELEALRPKLRAELLPETPLQEIGFEEIVCSVWRCRLAVRLEGRRLVALLDTAKDEETQTDEAGATTTISRWYVSG